VTGTVCLQHTVIPRKISMPVITLQEKNNIFFYTGLSTSMSSSFITFPLLTEF
jgi:hypothetical protein